MSKANEHSEKDMTVYIVTGDFNVLGQLTVKEAKGMKIQIDTEKLMEMKVETFTFKELPDGRAVRLDKNGNQMGEPISKEEYNRIKEKQKSKTKSKSKDEDKEQDK